MNLFSQYPFKFQIITGQQLPLLLRADSAAGMEVGKFEHSALARQDERGVGRSTRILLADHLVLVRESLRSAILRTDNDMSLVECDNFDTAVKIIDTEGELSLAILAQRLPGMNGFEGVRKFRDQFPELPLAIISGYYQYSDILRVFELGVVGFLSKEMSSEAIVNAIRLMVSGQRYVPEDVLATVFDQKGERHIGEEKDLCDILTERETEVLELMVHGNSNKLIARTLGLEEVTIKMHIGKILRKLGAENRTQAVGIAIKTRCKDCVHFPIKL